MSKEIYEYSYLKNITKSGNFALIFVNHHVLPDINFDGHCLINNNIL